MKKDFKLNSFYCMDVDIEENKDNVLEVSAFSDNMSIYDDDIAYIKKKYGVSLVYYGYFLWSTLDSTLDSNAEYWSFKIPYFEKDGKLYAPIKVCNDWFLFEDRMYSNSSILTDVKKNGCGKIYTNLNSKDLYECIAMTFTTDDCVSISKLEKSFMQCVLTRLGNIGELIKRNL